MITGCWDKVELENRGFIISIGIDRYDNKNKSNQAKEGLEESESDKYTVTAALPHVADMKESAVIDKGKDVKTADSSTVTGCLQLMDAASSQTLYLAHAKILLLGKDLLSDESLFRQALDAMERNRDISRKIYLMSTKERADGLLKLNLPGEPMLGLFVESYYKNKGAGGAFSICKVLEKVVSDLHSTGCTLIPEVEQRPEGNKEDQEEGKSEENNNDKGDNEEDKSGEITLGGCAVIKDYKLAGWLNDFETRGFAWVIGDCCDSEVNAPYNDRYLHFKVSKSKPKIRFSHNNGKLQCLIRVNVTGAINELDSATASDISSDMALSDADKLKFYEKTIEQAVSKEIVQTASRLQSEMAADIYNFKDLLRKKKYQLFLLYGDDWEKNFQEMEIIPDVKVDIISIGTLL